jgi:hypothetical protein
VQYKELRGDFQVVIPIPAIAAGTAAEILGLVAGFPILITQIRWLPSAAMAFNASNFVTLSVRNRGAAGAGTAVAASRAWSAVSSVALTPETLSLSGTATDLQLATGDQLTAGFVHSGTGLAVPAGSAVQVTCRGR